MPITTTAVSVTHPGNGSATALPVEFAFLDPTHLVVTHIGADGSETVLAFGVDYTVSTAEVGGTVTRVAAAATGESTRIDRYTPIVQPDTLLNQGVTYPARIEAMINRHTLVGQEMIARGVVGGAVPTGGAVGQALKRIGETGFGWQDDLGATLEADLASSEAGKGAALVTVKRAEAGAVARKVADKLADTICVKDFGAKGDGITDDATAIQAALAAAGSKGVYVPTGLYLCSTKITVPTGDFVMVGDGAGLSEIRFTSATASEQGFSATLGVSADYFLVRGLTLSTTTGYAAGKTALRIDGTAMLTGTYPARKIADRSSRRGLITDVVVKGIGTTTGWDIGAQFTSVGWFNIDNFTYWGDDSQGTTTGDWQGTAIRIDGEGVPVEMKLSNLWVYSAYYAVFCPDYLEGLYVSSFDFVNVRYGVYANFVSGVSVLPEANCGCLQPTLGPGHIKCYLGGVVATNVNQAFIGGLNIYVTSQPAYSNYYGIFLKNGANNYLRDCSIQDLGSSTNPSWGVVFDNIDRSFISRVAAYSFTDSGFYLKNDSDDNLVAHCLANGCINIAITDATSGSNWFVKNKGMSLSGASYGGSATSTGYIEKRAHVTATVVTLVGGAASEEASIAIPSGVFSDKPSVVVANAEASSQDILCTPVRDSASTTATNVVIKVFRRDGALIVGGSVRLHVVAYE
jgi:hypothetical protein